MRKNIVIFEASARICDGKISVFPSFCAKNENLDYYFKKIGCNLANGMLYLYMSKCLGFTRSMRTRYINMNFLLEESSIAKFWSEITRFFEFAEDAFLAFHWSDALDILFMTALFVIAFKFLRSRKAGALIVGIIVCLLVFLVAQILDLDGIKFILSGVFQFGILAIIILFQPEIRDALEKLGSGSISGFLSLREQKDKNQQYKSVIDNVTSAVRELSATKTGALIVIQRATPLDDITQTGITINADVNSFLIRNIFYDKAPLHDGAMVIEGSRITTAGCLLPLTKRHDVDGDLGTRHRAALGMSETSDAIIIVVSEETGTISVAFDCALIRGFTTDSLRRYLLKKLLKISDPGKDAD